MELIAMLYQRFIGSSSLSGLLATYAGRPAVFYQRAATADDPQWGTNGQFPRIDYNVDMQENPARNTSGVLTVNVWCDTEIGAEPESIEHTIRDLLHAVFAQADDYPYSFAWVRSDAFEAKGQDQQTVETIGITMIFDIMAFPCQYTLTPDPIRALNIWTLTILPNAIVIGESTISGWIEPTRETPIIYWRLVSSGISSKRFSHTWMTVSIEGHVYAKNAPDRLVNIARLNTAHALASHIPMEDGSPLFIKTFDCKPHMNYLSQGQIQATGNFGILQPWYNGTNTPKLNNVNYSEKDR